MEQPWGRLIRLGAAEGEPPVLLRRKEYTIGRRKGCDLSLPGNKLVSGDHCKIVVDEESGRVSLEDTSTNGTVINKVRIVKKQSYALQTGDIIYVVYRKNEPEHNVAYLYESLKAKSGISPELIEATGENVCNVTKDTSGLEGSDDTQVMPSLPNDQSCFEEPQPSTSTSDLFNTSSTSFLESATAEREPPSRPGEARCVSTSLEDQYQFATRDDTSNFLSAPLDKEGPSAFLSKPQDWEALGPAKKRMKGDGDTDMSLQLFVTDQCGNSRAIPEEVRAADMKPDKMEETLTCIICQELLHDCVSLQPCMHTFCAACYSGWMERSSLCPTCRCPVERICKNHILNNLVEAYLIQHPDKCRNEEDMRSMDARNKITQDMLQPKVRRSFSDEEGSSEDLLELSDVDSESSDIRLCIICVGHKSCELCVDEIHIASCSLAVFCGDICDQPYVVCRQCPGYRRQGIQPVPRLLPGSEGGAFETPGDAPSTSASFAAAAQDYVCPSQGSHAICTCCFQPMPDRRAEREQNPHIVAPQQCAVCSQPFCHLYWGCTRTGCSGCLAPFCEINLGEKCLDGVLNNNNYESDILKNYLASRNLTWKNVLNESLLALQRGLFLLSDYRITGNTVLCYCCGLRNFRELTYQYRQNIPASELPGTVTSRPDCYWGRNCRTQVKAHHAMKFNHICEQTRFKN